MSKKDKKKIISTIILASIGVFFGMIAGLFVTDAWLLQAWDITYSEVITDWLNESNGNLVLFIGGAVVFIVGLISLSIHWVFGKVKEKK